METRLSEFGSNWKSEYTCEYMNLIGLIRLRGRRKKRKIIIIIISEFISNVSVLLDGEAEM